METEKNQNVSCRRTGRAIITAEKSLVQRRLAKNESLAIFANGPKKSLPKRSSKSIPMGIADVKSQVQSKIRARLKAGSMPNQKPKIRAPYAGRSKQMRQGLPSQGCFVA